MIALLLALFVFAGTVLPAILLAINFRAYRPLPPHDPNDADRPKISLLIPARNEEASITAAVRSVLASTGVELEVIVLDDHSQDATAARILELAGQDPRVRLETAPPLPTGWCGKQHACWILAQQAKFDLLVWIDADVRLSPQALSRMAAFRRSKNVGLISGIPRQITASFSERLIIPLIHFVLLGYLPIPKMRQSLHPAFGAGCGQLFMARRDDYFRAGGHAAIRQSLHDGLTLPRAFRRAAIATDLFDATDLAMCRMYRGASQVWTGFSKNATEAMATPRAIVPWTLLLMAQILPWIVAPWLLLHRPPTVGYAATILWQSSLILSFACALAIGIRFRQSATHVVFHPIAIATLLAIQWTALARSLLGFAPKWKDRTYPAQA